MRIGIVVEGSYPYVSGGVASWVQMLMENLPEHQFEIIAITPGPMAEKDYKYSLPHNVTGVTNLPLNHHQQGEKPGKMNQQEQKDLFDWMMFKRNEADVFRLWKEKTGGTEAFFSSELFWKAVQESYQEEQQTGSFIEYFYMWRGMFTPVIELMQYDFPQVDLVHAVSTGYAGLVASAMKKEQDIPFILTEHGIYSREREEEILQARWIADYYKKRWIGFFHHLSRQAYEDADDIISLFERNNQLQAQIGAKEEKLSVIPNGIHYDRLSQLERKLMDKDMLIIGAIVRVVPIKDIKTMIQAAKLLKDAGVLFRLYILGPLDEDEEYAEECLQLVEQLELTSNVLFPGKVSIADYLPMFDVCLLTSISEGQPLAVLEGMAAGVPWIVTDVGACSELIYGRSDDPYGPAGFTVAPVHPLQIAEYCEWFYHHPEEARKFGLNGKKRVEQYYQIPHFIEKYRQLYFVRRDVYGGYRV
ncbi:DUF3492 domain-containing protein [Halobacillus fulvus]|nr:DUF3492 domain-containing protein [Halobacillus fulvus]